MQCRLNCGACCIAPSISSPLPGEPEGKPAGVACAFLSEDFRCELFDSPLRPAVCSQLKPCVQMCGESREEALAYLELLEKQTQPDVQS